MSGAMPLLSHMPSWHTQGQPYMCNLAFSNVLSASLKCLFTVANSMDFDALILKHDLFS